MSEILIAPLSHNPVRDWPVAHYEALIALLLDRVPTDMGIALIGTPNQRMLLNGIVRSFPADRVSSTCGLPWTEVIGRIRRASCVIGNNSGVAHLAGLFGVATVCIFGGSHQRTEWAPLRPSVTILSRVIGCSPCQLHHIRDCPYAIKCLRDIAPQTVAEATLAALEPGMGPERRRAGKAI